MRKVYLISINNLEIEIDVDKDDSSFTLQIPEHIFDFSYVDIKEFCYLYKTYKYEKLDYPFRLTDLEYYFDYDLKHNFMYSYISNRRIQLIEFENVEQYKCFLRILYEVVVRYI